MIFRRILLISLVIFLSGNISAQKAYWVFFKDKNGTTFNPYTYFATEAIERRTKLGISLYDSSDFPVNENYISEVGKLVQTVGYPTRWFNGVGVIANDEQIKQVSLLSFVKNVKEQQSINWLASSAKNETDTSNDDVVGVPDPDVQVNSMAGKMFAEHQLAGKGIVIAIIDVGFHGVDVHPAFDRLRFNNGIRATFDFSKDRADVYGPKSDHGTSVLSCIAGIKNEKNMGLAPDATFLLAKIATPWTNQPRGEEYFIAALEWSDKQGAMLVNCSDGPDYESYFPEQMNGEVSLMSRAANKAASKGILVISAAGNEGESSSPVLLPPADADSVLSVTALNVNGYIASYSSIGPTPDYKHKPDVSAPGTVVVANGYNSFVEDEGTSFSSPLIVGFAACVIQKYPDLSPIQLMDTLHKCASLYPYFDYAHGYGIPRADYFFDSTQVNSATFIISRIDNYAEIKIDEKFKPDCSSSVYPKLYYNLEDEKGRIYKYYVKEINTGAKIRIPEADLRQGVKINVFYQGYYAALQL
ncbi:S8 family serine peptidase [soil metagenome]